MAGDIDAPRDPHARMAADVIEESPQADHSPWTADKAAV
jgi:hypothetical protein